MIETKRIDHINLIVNSLERAKSYYEKVFGFHIFPRENNPRMLVVESKETHFFMTEMADTPEAFLRTQHISFEVENLEQVIHTLDTFGITDYRAGKIDFFQYRNYRWCEWRDPDGIRLECVEVLK